MDPDELVTVYKVTDANEAQIIRGALRSEGIACELGGLGQAGFAGVWEIDVMVRAADADRARKIIESHQE